MPKLIRITTVPVSLKTLLKGQHQFMSQNGFEVIGISSAGPELKDVEKEEGIRTHTINMTRKITPFQDLKALFQLIRFLRKEKPEIVHTHTPKAGLLGMMAAKIAGVPHRLHTVAGMPLTVATGAKRQLLNFIEKITYFCATKVYPNSIGLKKLILEYGFTKEKKLKVIGKGSSNGINTSDFDPQTVKKEESIALRKSLGIKEDDFVFIFVGRIVTDKGINELIQAFNTIYYKAKNKDFHLVLVGSYEKELDPLQSETEQIIQDNPHIHSLGYQNNVVPYFAMADVLTFPSYREGFPNVVMQAASMQLNAIVTDINGCNEIISDGENGWIIPVENKQQLANKMQWCLENPEKSKEMGLKSRAIMQKDFERSFVQGELLKEYQNLLAK